MRRLTFTVKAYFALITPADQELFLHGLSVFLMRAFMVVVGVFVQLGRAADTAVLRGSGHLRYPGLDIHGVLFQHP